MAPLHSTDNQYLPTVILPFSKIECFLLSKVRSWLPAHLNLHSSWLNTKNLGLNMILEHNRVYSVSQFRIIITYAFKSSVRLRDVGWTLHLLHSQTKHSFCWLLVVAGNSWEVSLFPKGNHKHRLMLTNKRKGNPRCFLVKERYKGCL
jgi:hypothetical protein